MNAVRLSPPTGSRNTASLIRVETSRLRLEMATWVAAQPASRLSRHEAIRRARSNRSEGRWRGSGRSFCFARWARIAGVRPELAHGLASDGRGGRREGEGKELPGETPATRRAVRLRCRRMGTGFGKAPRGAGDRSMTHLSGNVFPRRPIGAGPLLTHPRAGKSPPIRPSVGARSPSLLRPRAVPGRHCGYSIRRAARHAGAPECVSGRQGRGKRRCESTGCDGGTPLHSGALVAGVNARVDSVNLALQSSYVVTGPSRACGSNGTILVVEGILPAPCRGCASDCVAARRPGAMSDTNLAMRPCTGLGTLDGNAGMTSAIMPALPPGGTALGSPSSQPSAPMAGSWLAASADASPAAHVVAASTSFNVSCELQATDCTLHGDILSPYCIRLMAAFRSRSRARG